MRIPLTKGYYAIVDDADAWVVDYRWYAKADSKGIVYAARNGPRPKRGTIHMHRAIMGAKPGEQVDHQNRNCLDNRRSNLRICTQSQNTCNSKKRRDNTSGFKGVSLYKRTRKWHAQITAGRKIHLGSFHKPEEAYTAYKEASRRLHGKFGRVA